MLIFFGTSGDLGYLKNVMAENGFSAEVIASDDLVRDGWEVAYLTFLANCLRMLPGDALNSVQYSVSDQSWPSLAMQSGQEHGPLPELSSSTWNRSCEKRRIGPRGLNNENRAADEVDDCHLAVPSLDLRASTAHQ
jgi:hypothetical protein